MQRSGQAETSKVSILVNELVRRFEVMDDRLEINEEIEIINHFTAQLRNSGYQYKQARDIIVSALKGIMKKKSLKTNLSLVVAGIILYYMRLKSARYVMKNILIPISHLLLVRNFLP